MAVRKKVDPQQSLAESEPDEELRLNQLVRGAVKERVIKECVKGLFAYPVAIVGVLLMYWSSKSNGFNYWFGTISGLVIMAVGMGYGAEFLKQLIKGGLTGEIVTTIKDYPMKEWMRVFLAFLSIGGGICLFLTAKQISYYLPVWVPYCVGLIMFAGGITFFWTRSRFYKG